MTPVRRALLTLSAAYFFVGATSLGVIGLVGGMRASLEVSAGAIAWLVTVFAVVYAVAAPGAQALFGHVPRRTLVAAGLIAVTLSCLLAAVAWGYWAMVASRVGMAVGAALVGPTAQAAAASLVPPERRAAALATVFTGLTLSTVLGVPIASWLGQAFGWRWAWVAMGAASAAVLPFVLAAVPADNRGARFSLRALVSVMADRALALSISTTAFNMAGQFATYALIAAWLTEVAGAAPELVPATLFLFGIGGVLGNVLAPRVERRLGPPRAVLLTIAGVILPLLAVWAFAPGGVVALALITVWATFGLMYMIPLQTRLVGLDAARAPLSLALNASAIYVGMSVGSAVSALVYDRFGAAAMPLASVAIMALAALVFAASLRR